MQHTQNLVEAAPLQVYYCPGPRQLLVIRFLPYTVFKFSMHIVYDAIFKLYMSLQDTYPSFVWISADTS
jgi:hypothetical protein